MVVWLKRRGNGNKLSRNGGIELEKLEWDTVMAHSAQLMCYGFMYCAENATNFITLRLTYYNYDDDDIKTIEK